MSEDVRSNGHVPPEDIAGWILDRQRLRSEGRFRCGLAEPPPRWLVELPIQDLCDAIGEASCRLARENWPSEHRIRTEALLLRAFIACIQKQRQKAARP